MPKKYLIGLGISVGVVLLGWGGFRVYQVLGTRSEVTPASTPAASEVSLATPSSGDGLPGLPSAEADIPVNNAQADKTIEEATKTLVDNADNLKKLSWGMTFNVAPYPELGELERFNEVNDAQIASLKALNPEIVRLTFPIDTPDRGLAIVDKLHNLGFKVFLVLEPYAGDWKKQYPGDEERGYEFAKSVVAQVGPFVDYYQLANEIGGSAIKGAQFPGIKLDQYNKDKLDETLDFVKGASRAVANFDPTAKRVVSINSLHTAIVKEAIDRKIGFDVVGWNWFSDFGKELEKPILNDQTKETYPFMETMRGFGKDLWVTEISRRGGAADGNEKAQAEFVTYGVKKVADAGFTAVFPFLLVEDVVGLPGYGLMHPKKDTTGKWVIDRPRQAYTAYQNLIKQYR